MAQFREIPPSEISDNPFTLIGQDWMAVTAAAEGRVNTMTASWGGLGILWGLPVATIYVRPQRYTREMIDGSRTFSLSVFDEAHRPTLSYFGSVSGRDADKIEVSGLTVAYERETPYFAEARLVLLCRKLYRQALSPEDFVDPVLAHQWCPDGDYHILYVGAVEKVLRRE
ncbi:MAG: flavin reductase family protein [Schwartzia sp. (in: firmicutes)]